jgi:hypothetical protein
VSRLVTSIPVAPSTQSAGLNLASLTRIVRDVGLGGDLAQDTLVISSEIITPYLTTGITSVIAISAGIHESREQASAHDEEQNDAVFT